MAVVQDPTVQRRKLRVELRKAREQAGRKQAEVASAMDWSPSKLMRIESGQVSISTNDLKALLNYYGVKDMARVNSMLELARSARGASYYDQFADLLKAGFSEYLAYESYATVLRQWDPVLVPGLLQTEEYARAILADAVGHSQENVDRAWAVRQHRQELHDRDDPPDMLFIVDEAVVRRQVGSPRMMLHQLERIKEVAGLQHVSLQIMPFSRGAHPGVLGNFILLEFSDPDLDSLVHLESVNAITVRDDAEVITRYMDRFLRLEELALTPDESMAMLDKLIGEQSATASTNAPTKKAAS